MRKFYLQNSVGDVIPLNGEDGIWFAEPTGLGEAFTNKYTSITNGFFTRTSGIDTQGSVSGTLAFVRQGYSKYKTVMDWIARAGELFLVYQPADTKYLRKVELKTIGKTELSEAHWLKCAVVFHCLTPWFTATHYKLQLQRDSGESMVYGTWQYGVHAYGYSSTNYSTDINGTGHINDSLLITWTGTVNNPVITLTDASGHELGRCAVTASFASTDKLVLCTDYNNSYIKKISGNVETDLIDSVNIAYNPWLRPPCGEISTLTMTGTDMNGSGVIDVYSYWRTV